MDKLTRYREIVRRLVEDYGRPDPADENVNTYAMIDTERDHYIAMQTGWTGRIRAHGAFLHLDIIDGKVWIQFNGTDQDIGGELEAAGIPKSDIVIGEQPVELRPHTGYAVG